MRLASSIQFRSRVADVTRGLQRKTNGFRGASVETHDVKESSHGLGAPGLREQALDKLRESCHSDIEQNLAYQRTLLQDQVSYEDIPHEEAVRLWELAHAHQLQQKKATRRLRLSSQIRELHGLLNPKASQIPPHVVPDKPRIWLRGTRSTLLKASWRSQPPRVLPPFMTSSRTAVNMTYETSIRGAEAEHTCVKPGSHLRTSQKMKFMILVRSTRRASSLNP